jgi:hypothetical protein
MRFGDELEFEDLLGYAGALGLDVERFARELELGVHSGRVARSRSSCDGRHAGSHDAATLAAALEASRSRPCGDRERV